MSPGERRRRTRRLLTLPAVLSPGVGLLIAVWGLFLLAGALASPAYADTGRTGGGAHGGQGQAPSGSAARPADGPPAPSGRSGGSGPSAGPSPQTSPPPHNAGAPGPGAPSGSGGPGPSQPPASPPGPAPGPAQNTVSPGDPSRSTGSDASGPPSTDGPPADTASPAPHPTDPGPSASPPPPSSTGTVPSAPSAPSAPSGTAAAGPAQNTAAPIQLQTVTAPDAIPVIRGFGPAGVYGDHYGDAEPTASPIGDGGNPGEVPPAPAGPSAPAAVADPMIPAAGPWRGMSWTTATQLRVPIIVLVGAAVFLLAQALVDRRDPKVSSAPERVRDGTVGFE